MYSSEGVRSLWVCKGFSLQDHLLIMVTSICEGIQLSERFSVIFLWKEMWKSVSNGLRMSAFWPCLGSIEPSTIIQTLHCPNSEKEMKFFFTSHPCKCNIKHDLYSVVICVGWSALTYIINLHCMCVQIILCQCFLILRLWIKHVHTRMFVDFVTGVWCFYFKFIPEYI